MRGILGIDSGTAASFVSQEMEKRKTGGKNSVFLRVRQFLCDESGFSSSAAAHFRQTHPASGDSASLGLFCLEGKQSRAYGCIRSFRKNSEMDDRRTDGLPETVPQNRKCSEERGKVLEETAPDLLLRRDRSSIMRRTFVCIVL